MIFNAYDDMNIMFPIPKPLEILEFFNICLEHFQGELMEELDAPDVNGNGEVNEAQSVI